MCKTTVPGSCRRESYTLHWTWPVLCDTQLFQSPWNIAWAVMILSPENDEAFHSTMTVDAIEPMKPRKAKVKPRSWIPALAIVWFEKIDDESGKEKKSSSTFLDVVPRGFVCGSRFEYLHILREHPRAEGGSENGSNLDLKVKRRTPSGRDGPLQQPKTLFTFCIYTTAEVFSFKSHFKAFWLWMDKCNSWKELLFSWQHIDFVFYLPCLLISVWLLLKLTLISKDGRLTHPDDSSFYML